MTKTNTTIITSVLLGMLFVGSASIAYGQTTLYGTTGSGNSPSSLYTIDTTTGVATLVGPVSFSGCGALDIHPTTGILYGVCGNGGAKQLVTIDTSNGIGTAIGPLVFSQQISDISFRSDGTLFAYHEPSDNLGTIDTITGLYTQIGSTFTGCCGNGMAFDSSDVLFHTNDQTLNTLDQTTAVATVQTFLTYPGIGFDRINGMDFEPTSGVLFGSLNSGSFGFGPNNLVTVDTATGIVTIIGPTIVSLDAITFELGNESPDCSNSVASTNSLWPPNHKMKDISILGVTDADGDLVTITVDGITQDEPVNDTGDGDTSPDGSGVGTDTAQVRSERSGTGDGRVYEISFTADDGNGGSCSGSVEVGVPHDKKDTSVNSGQTVDSTGP